MQSRVGFRGVPAPVSPSTPVQLHLLHTPIVPTVLHLRPVKDLEKRRSEESLASLNCFDQRKRWGPTRYLGLGSLRSQDGDANNIRTHFPDPGRGRRPMRQAKGHLPELPPRRSSVRAVQGSAKSATSDSTLRTVRDPTSRQRGAPASRAHRFSNRCASFSSL